MSSKATEGSDSAIAETAVSSEGFTAIAEATKGSGKMATNLAGSIVAIEGSMATAADSVVIVGSTKGRSAITGSVETEMDPTTGCWESQKVAATSSKEDSTTGCYSERRSR